MSFKIDPEELICNKIVTKEKIRALELLTKDIGRLDFDDDVDGIEATSDFIERKVTDEIPTTTKKTVKFESHKSNEIITPTAPPAYSHLTSDIADKILQDVNILLASRNIKIINNGVSLELIEETQEKKCVKPDEVLVPKKITNEWTFDYKLRGSITITKSDIYEMIIKSKPELTNQAVNNMVDNITSSREKIIDYLDGTKKHRGIKRRLKQ
nr:P protein [Shanxi Armigeres subalbatus rhabdovirus]